MSTVQEDNHHYVVITLFALMALSAGLVTTIVMTAFGKISDVLAATLIPNLIIVIAGIAAYYLSD